MSPVQEASPGENEYTECKEDDGKKKGLADKIERRKVGVLCVYMPDGRGTKRKRRRPYVVL